MSNYKIENGKLIFDGEPAVGGSLYLRGTQITELPDNLSVGGSLDLRGTQITELPDNLSVVGYLDLEGTQITELPDNLSVFGSLDLHGTQITELPDNLSVGGSLYLDEEKILNIGYAKYCGYSNRTIFSVRLNGTEKIAAGCFLGTYEEFCTAVDEDYDSKGAKEYKQKAQEALAMLRERTGSKAA